jgi:hypothetical protein
MKSVKASKPVACFEPDPSAAAEAWPSTAETRYSADSTSDNVPQNHDPVSLPAQLLVKNTGLIHAGWSDGLRSMVCNNWRSAPASSPLF